MSYNKCIFIATMLAFPQLLNAGWKKDFEDSQIRADIHTEVFYSTATEDLDFNYSHIQFQWLNGQKMNLDEAKQQFKRYGAKHFEARRVFLNFNGEFSSAPYLVKDSSEDKALDTVGATADDYRDQVIQQYNYLESQIEMAVDQAIQANPQLAPFRNDMIASGRLAQQAYYDQIDAANAKIDYEEQQAREEIKDRTDKLALETSIQEVTVDLGYIFTGKFFGGELAMFARGGKLKVKGGLITGPTDQTPLEEVTAQNVFAQRGMDTSGTTGVNLTNILRFQNYSVQTDIYVFHNRIPWQSAEQYVTSVLAFSQEAWDKHDDLYDIDSAMVRLLLDHNAVQAYVSLGSYDGNEAFGVGGVIKVTNKGRLYVDYFTGDREYVADSGLSAYYVHEVDGLPFYKDKVDVFIGAEKYTDSYVPHLYRGKSVDGTKFGLGLSTRDKKWLLKGHPFYWKLKAGLYRYNAEDANTGEDLGTDNYGVGNFSLKF